MFQKGDKVQIIDWDETCWVAPIHPNLPNQWLFDDEYLTLVTKNGNSYCKSYGTG